MKSHINIPIFIPHLGCPNQCVFCNQRSISGVKEFDPLSVVSIIEESIATSQKGADVEIAFFGGSFTGIDRSLMIDLLSIAKRYIDSGAVSSVRCSTRPDYISDEILEILKQYGVKTIELGLQSTSDSVLDLCKRGHSFEDEKNACQKILDYGFVLGGQMMIGLPGSTLEDEIKTAEFIVNSGAKEARIYPTVVFNDTELCSMSEKGFYNPISLESAIERSAVVYKIFLDGGVRILRIGLCESENLHSDSTYYAGPNHPAIGELVENSLYYKIVSEQIEKHKNLKGSSVTVYVSKGHTSKVIGQNRINKNRLIGEFGLSSIKVKETDKLSTYNILLDIQERK